MFVTKGGKGWTGYGASLRSLPSGPRGRGGDRHDHDHERWTTAGIPQEGRTLPLALPADVHGVLCRWGDLGRSVLWWRRTHRLSEPDRPSSRVLDPGTRRHPYAADGGVDALSPSRVAALTGDGIRDDGVGDRPGCLRCGRPCPNRCHVRVGDQPGVSGHAHPHAVAPQALYGRNGPPRVRRMSPETES